MSTQARIISLLSAETYPAGSLTVLVGITIIFLVWIGNGHPTYKNVPKVSRPFVKYFIDWEPASPFRLQTYEAEGYKKLFGVDAMILPAKYLPSLKKINRHSLNFAQHLNDNMNMEATVGDIAIANDMEIDLVSRFMNRKMTPIISELADEANYQFRHHLGDLPEFQTFNCYELCARLVHNISSRALVGIDLCRDPKYMAACTKYTQTVFISGVLWNFLPLGIFRKPFYWLVSLKFRWDLHKATDYIRPKIQERMDERDIAWQSKGEKSYYMDVIQFALDQITPSPRENDASRHARRIVHLSFASTGTSISLTYNLIWHLLLQPEILGVLRTEIETSLEQHGREWSKTMLDSLHLLDSFIRETLRHHPAACFSGQRTAMESITLPDGMNLKPRSRIAFAAASTNMDPDNYKDASSFDALRFAGPDFSHRSEGRVKAAVFDEKFLSWGYGKQACPGRFYAVRLVKLVFGLLIHEYDIEWDSSKKEFPKVMAIEGTFLADMKANIRVRSRERNAPSTS
uniref:Ent-kaurene oxidase n=1 Tax=Talaromyces marneffei PM1 TaxID=1077442 RepID=A0A093Y6M0_TALMA